MCYNSSVYDSAYAAILLAAASAHAAVQVGGELKQWQKVTLTFDGPRTAENATPNPFRDYRLNVTFTHGRSGRS